jgi:hypothetical protein
MNTTTNANSRLHNKSGLEEITILTYPDDVLTELDAILATALANGRAAAGLLPTLCTFTRAIDGRLSKKGRKPCYAYQLVALRRYNRDRLKRVTASKLGKDIAISHLCGSPVCCTPNHLFLETKQINDERTHCHFVLQKIRNANNNRYRRFVEGNKYQFCTHTPRCGMPLEQGETASQEVQQILSEEEEEED